MDVPGASGEGIEIKPGPAPGTLELNVPLAPPRERETDGAWLRNERRTGRGATRLTRVIPVGWDADVAKATCDVEHGILHVRVPRRVPTNDRGEGPQA